MIAPGTPAITLPAYAVPAFSAATVALGAVVTSVTLENTSAASQSNVPFTFGQPFKKGELAPDDCLVGGIAGEANFPLQMNVKATHPDGSVRHAIISGLLPTLPASGFKVVQLVRSTVAGTPPTAASDEATHSAVIVVEGVEYTASTVGAAATWLVGHTANELIYNVPFLTGSVQHPHLTAQFAVRNFPGAQRSKIDVTIEHTKAYTAIADVTYDVRILIGGEQCYAQAGLAHFPCSRWKKTFWRGAAPALHIKHDTAYLIATMAVPNYDQRVKMTESTLAGYVTMLAATTFAPMGRGRFAASFGTTGGRPELGLAPDSYAAAILSMDKRAKDMMLASADVAGSWPAHRRDTSAGPANGRPIDILHWPRSTLGGTPLDSLNKLTGGYEKFPAITSTSNLSPDTSHQAAFAYIPYLLTGDFYYLEELHFWGNYCLYTFNPGYRMGEQGLVKNDQVRGQGWTLRTLAEAAYITPDQHPSKAAFKYWVDCNFAWYNANYTDAPATPGIKTASYDPAFNNSLGLIANGPFGAYDVAGGVDNGMAPWMDDFFTSAVGHAAELGFTEAARLLKWKAKFQIGRMVAPGYDYIDAAVYALKVRDTATSPLYQTLRECHAKTFPDMVDLPFGSQARLDSMNARRELPSSPFVLNEMPRYASIPTGYPSNLQPALAMAVDSGLEGGSQAWSLFENRAVKPNYGTAPQFAIVPRAPAVVQPPVVVEPPPAPTPPPTPTPAPVPTPVPTPPPAVRGTVAISNGRIVPGTEYVVTVTSASGQILAVEFPVIAT